MISGKAFKVFCFIIRIALDIKLKLVVKTCFCAIVCPILEYLAVV